MSEELVKAYITQYALTRGIFATVVETTHIDTMVSTTSRFKQYFHKPDWHLTYEEAVARAEEMRQKKIASLEKQLAKLKAMTFPETEGDS